MFNSQKFLAKASFFLRRCYHPPSLHATILSSHLRSVLSGHGNHVHHLQHAPFSVDIRKFDNYRSYHSSLYRHDLKIAFQEVDAILGRIRVQHYKKWMQFWGDRNHLRLNIFMWNHQYFQIQFSGILIHRSIPMVMLQYDILILKLGNQ